MPGYEKRGKSIAINFKWYDLWIGAYWDRKNHILYICPLPCIVITSHRNS
jgi:hypothetical protein